MFKIKVRNLNDKKNVKDVDSVPTVTFCKIDSAKTDIRLNKLAVNMLGYDEINAESVLTFLAGEEPTDWFIMNEKSEFGKSYRLFSNGQVKNKPIFLEICSTMSIQNQENVVILELLKVEDEEITIFKLGNPITKEESVSKQEIGTWKEDNQSQDEIDWSELEDSGLDTPMTQEDFNSEEEDVELEIAVDTAMNSSHQDWDN